MVPSAILSVFLYDEVIHLTLDSGCTGNIIRLDVVERLNIPMKPTKVKIVVETRLFTADFPWKLGCK